jgi:hypothetical protein
MIEYDFEKMSNNEIKIEMKKLEKSFEKIKFEIVDKLKNLSKLDALYIKAKTELNKRNQTEL